MIRRSLTTLLLAGGLALAAPGLDVRPAGDQQFDPLTGVTTLPHGGTVTDSDHGLRLQAKWIELKQGEFFRATGATLSAAETGTIRAANIDYQVRADRLVATGDLSFSGTDSTGMTAERVVAFPDAGKVVALGQVRGTKPAIRADAVALDAAKREVFLYGNYSFQDGKTRLASAKPDAGLLVTVAANGKLSTTTRPDPARLMAYLDMIERARR